MTSARSWLTLSRSSALRRLDDVSRPLRERATSFGAAGLSRLLGPLRFGGAVLLYALAARAWLFWELSHVEITPFNHDPACCNLLQLAHWARDDVFFAYACTKVAIVAGLVLVVLGWLGKRREGARGSLISHCLAALGLIVIGLIHAFYYRVAFLMHAALDYPLISQAFQSGFDWADFTEYVTPIDLVIIVAPVVAYAALCASSLVGRAVQALVLTAGAAAVLTIPVPGLERPRRELRVNPPLAVLTSVLTDWKRPRPFTDIEQLPTPADVQALGLGGLPTVTQQATPAPDPRGPVSVVVVILESVGRRYAFAGDAAPLMPRLTLLRDSSLYLSNHLSPSNSSMNSLFSIFTGLYPSPSRVVLATQPGLRLPVLLDYLPWVRDAFLVTPGRLNSYFPRGLLRNAGIEMHDRYDLGLAQLRPYPGVWAADERDGVDAFLARLGRAQTPYFGVYYSYAAHNAYYDHGPEFRVMPDLDNPFHRYQNNLRLLDVELSRILDAIRARPERTLLVILGDHGEAFEQHPGNVKHSLASFQENFETFALLNLPGTFEGRVISQRTLHVDLVPTILSALHVPFAPSAFQGVDLMLDPPPRPYAFLYGTEDTVSSIDADGVKLQLSYAREQCWVFDLGKDPDERRELDCSAFERQKRLTGMYHAFQPQALRELQGRVGSTR